MIRHILLSNPSMQIWRQVDSRLMEHLWGQSSRVWLPMGRKYTGTYQFWSGGRGICSPWSYSCRAWADLQQGSCQQVCSWFCTSYRPCLKFWTAGFLAGAESPGERHLRWGWSHEGCGRLTISNVHLGCTISSVDLGCCWWGSNTTDAYCSNGCTRPL